MLTTRLDHDSTTINPIKENNMTIAIHLDIVAIDLPEGLIGPFTNRAAALTFEEAARTWFRHEWPGLDDAEEVRIEILETTADRITIAPEELSFEITD